MSRDNLYPRYSEYRKIAKGSKGSNSVIGPDYSTAYKAIKHLRLNPPEMNPLEPLFLQLKYDRFLSARTLFHSYLIHKFDKVHVCVHAIRRYDYSFISAVCFNSK